jgi:hypothetical protein
MFGSGKNSEIPVKAFIQTLKEDNMIARILDVYNQGEPNNSIILFTKLMKARK